MPLTDVEVSTERSRLDIPLVADCLNQSYWASGRSREVIERSIDNSLCFGVYMGGRQIAFARVITDRAVFAYLADVFVVPDRRGQGVGTHLMKAILDHPDLQRLTLFMLRTRDAHGFYEQYGFGPVDRPEELMARTAPMND